MSHLPHRKEKDCLNCGSIVKGPFCQNCGQENIEPKESFWHLVVHFFNDITHFDGKFFTTMKSLMTRPGFLSKEYVKGRRASYINPIRMYLFTSFLFFLLFFSLNHLSEKDFENVKKPSPISNKISKNSATPLKDSTVNDSIRNNLNQKVLDDSSRIVEKDGEVKFVFFDYNNYKSQRQYDSLIKIGAVKDGWLKRNVIRKSLEVSDKYSNNEADLQMIYLNQLLHSFPQLLFISLPFVALILKIFYNRRKQFYYVGHAIFSLHLYIFIFIMMMVSVGIVQLKHASGFGKISLFNVLITLFIFVYLYKSMRVFYGQSRTKTLLKYFLLLFSLLFLFSFLTIAFAIFSIFKV